MKILFTNKEKNFWLFLSLLNKLTLSLAQLQVDTKNRQKLFQVFKISQFHHQLIGLELKQKINRFSTSETLLSKRKINQLNIKSTKELEISNWPMSIHHTRSSISYKMISSRTGIILFRVPNLFKMSLINLLAWEVRLKD